MPSFQWARLKESVKAPLRLGGWYRILKLTPTEATVDIKGKPVPVPRAHLQLALTPSQRWTVVPAPKNAPRFPAAWGKQYGVCPNCRDRASLNGEPASMRCHRCNGLFEVAWNEPYLASA